MINKKFDVLVVGELNIDLILNKIQKFPEVGKEVIARGVKQTLGSSSAIFANNLSVLGSNVSFIGKVGYDSYAAQISAILKKAGVNVDNLIKSPNSLTGLTVAFNYGNDRAMITYPGAMEELKVEEISDDILQLASHLHVSSIFLQTALKADIVTLFKRAKQFNITTSLDPQWDPNEKWDIDLKALLPYVDIFLPNEIEILKLTKSSSVAEAINRIKSYSNIIVVKQGTKGATMWDKIKITQHPAYLNAQVVDAIGAGDSFNAGFISKYIKRKALTECLDYAALIGAVNTTAAGGIGAFKDLEKMTAIIKSKFNKQ